MWRESASLYPRASQGMQYMRKKTLEVKAGVTIYASTGMNGFGQPDRMSSIKFYLANKGNRLHLLDKNYYYNVATYTLDFNEKYLHTYTYAPDQLWGTYAKDLGGDTYRKDDYIFEEKRYFRICLKRVDGAPFAIEEEQRMDEILHFFTEEEKMIIGTSDFFQKEVDKTVKKIQRNRKEDTLRFAILTDTHYTVNGTWADTAKNLCAVHKKIAFDSVIHLGDLTDGMVPASLTRTYAKQMICDLQSMKVPIHIVLGNHDANYFAGNPEVMTIEEQVQIYQQHSSSYKSHKNTPYYYMDYHAQKVRCIFLSAYDNREKIRYGFDEQQIDWVQTILSDTLQSYQILIFSHDAPLARLDFWSEKIRNGEALMTVLEVHQEKCHNIFAFIHGHTHADFIYTERVFPIISVGCAKCEDMQEKKPEGSFTAKRELGTVSQELWDTLIVHPKEKKLEFVRFGAGYDRQVHCIKGLDKEGE